MRSTTLAYIALAIGAALATGVAGNAAVDRPQPFPFPDLSGLGQQLEARFSQLRAGLPTAPASAPDAPGRATYTSLTPEGVKQRVADATTSAWGQLVIGPTDKGISIWRRTVP
jgi:hypothetical protein